MFFLKKRKIERYRQKTISSLDKVIKTEFQEKTYQRVKSAEEIVKPGIFERVDPDNPSKNIPIKGKIIDWKSVENDVEITSWSYSKQALNEMLFCAECLKDFFPEHKTNFEFLSLAGRVALERPLPDKEEKEKNNINREAFIKVVKDTITDLSKK